MKKTWITMLLMLTILMVQSPALKTALAQSGGTRDIPSSNQIPQPANNKLNVGNVLTTENQNQPQNIGGFIIRVVNFLSVTIGSFAFLALVVGGIMLVTSTGKEEKVTKGKDVIKGALLGLLIAFGAYWTTAFVQSIFYDT